MDEKICTKCTKSQPLTEFYRGKKWKDGLHPWCKTCFNSANKARREKKCIESPPSYRWNRDSICHTYFSAVDKPIQAYILGFLAADGTIVSSLPRIDLELSVKDYELLEFVRDELAPNHTIHRRLRERSSTRFASGESATLSFTSPQMVTDLARFGIVPKKTLTMQWPSELPEHLERDFLLGYFDGDGSITSTVNFGCLYHVWTLCSGSIKFLEEVISIVKKHTGIHLGGPYKKLPSKTGVIRVTGSKAIMLDEWLHISGLGLARKRIANKLTPPDGNTPLQQKLF